VEDAPASLFAETFYDALLAGNLSFGEAVFQARCATWDRYPASITWGAYQAYGDPSWRVDPKSDAPSPRLQTGWGGVAPEELLDRIETEREVIQRSGEVMTRLEAKRMGDMVQQWLATMPSDWSRRPDLLSAVADLYADLGPGFFELARDCYRQAIALADPEGKVPIRAIEHLANVEARLGDASDDAALVAQGIERLQNLVRLTGGTPPDLQGESAPRLEAGSATAERAGLLGSAWKRKAGVHARAYLATGKPREFTRMQEALTHSSASYRAMASRLGDPDVHPYQTLNWLFLWSLTAPPKARRAYLPHVQRCATAANAAFIEDPDTYNSTMVPDAALLAALLDDSLAVTTRGDAAFDSLVSGYLDALQTVLATPKERDSVVQQIRLIALFHRAYEKHKRAGAAKSVGARLELLADRLSDSGPSTGNLYGKTGASSSRSER